jgi:hypothetical protein
VLLKRKIQYEFYNPSSSNTSEDIKTRRDKKKFLEVLESFMYMKTCQRHRIESWSLTHGIFIVTTNNKNNWNFLALLCFTERDWSSNYVVARNRNDVSNTVSKNTIYIYDWENSESNSRR